MPVIIAAIQSYVSLGPTTMGIDGFHRRRCRIRVLSEFLPRAPWAAFTRPIRSESAGQLLASARSHARPRLVPPI